MQIFSVLFLALLAFAGIALSAVEQPIIDVHLHVYGDDWLPYPPHTGAAGTAGDVSRPTSQEELIVATLAEMDKHNIVLGLLHDRPENIEKLRRRGPDRFLAYPDLRKANLQPTVKEFDSRFSAREWDGIGEIRTVYNGLRPTDPDLWQYYETANRHDVPVFWHTGGSFPGTTRRQPEFRMEIGRPLNWEDILVKYPDLRVVLVHGGYPFLDEMLAVIRQYPSVYIDIGAIVHIFPKQEFYRYFGTLINAGFGRRILFGSDQMGWPETIGYSVNVVKDAPWPEEVKRDILYNNAARFLRLSDERINEHHRR